MQSSMASVEDSLVILENETVFAYSPVNVFLGIYPTNLNTYHPYLHMDIKSSSMHNCWKLEATKISFSELDNMAHTL